MDDFAHIVGEDVHFRGRSPPGERGLKFGHQLRARVCAAASLPTRGAWIEINGDVRPVLPRRLSRSPPGERGLKCGRGA